MVALETWPVLSRAAVESVTVIVVPLADDFSTAHDDAATAVMQRGLDGLLQTEGQMTVRSRRHYVIVRAVLQVGKEKLLGRCS